MYNLYKSELYATLIIESNDCSLPYITKTLVKCKFKFVVHQHNSINTK